MVANISGIETINLIVHEFHKNTNFSSPKKLEIFIDEALLKLTILEKTIDPKNLSKKNIKQLNFALNNLIDDIHSKGEFEQKFQSCLEQIQRIQAHITHPNELTKEESTKPITLKLMIFSNLDAQDANGIILRNIESAFKQEIPFITTRSQLCCSGEDNISSDIFNLRHQAEEKSAEWDIYQQSGSEYLLFLPKSLLSEKQGLEKLNALDFVTDGSLKKIEPKDAFQVISVQKATVQQFAGFFVDKPKVNKLFYLSGHGLSNTVGGLKDSNYLQFLDVLEDQRCKCLILASCYSGGESSLLHLPKPLEDKAPHSFIVIPLSIGDFATSGYETKTRNNKNFLNQLATFIDDGKPKTKGRLRGVLKGFSGSEISNYSQVYFPPAKDSPGGFTPIGEVDIAHSITLIKARGGREIDVADTDVLEINPTLVNAKVKVKGDNVKLLSLIPGTARHFIQSLEFADPKSNLEKFIDNTYFFYTSSIFSDTVSKGFIIGNLEGIQNYSELAFCISTAGAEAVYKSEGKYFHYNRTFHDEKKEISELEHAMIFHKIKKSTNGNEEAIRSKSGGQESTEVFEEYIEDSFWSTPSSDVREFVLNITNKPDEEILAYCGGLTSEQKVQFVFFLLEQGRFRLSQTVIEQENIDPNSVSLNNAPLLSTAIQNNAFELVDYLIQKNADVNSVNKNNLYRSPVHEAILTGNNAILERLLKAPTIQVDLKDVGKCTPLFYALKSRNQDGYRMLVGAGASINSKIKNLNNTDTLLSHCISTGLIEQAGWLLDDGADPNLGDPSAIIHALFSNNVDLLKKVIEHGGDPHENLFSPFVLSVLYFPLDTVSLFLESYNDEENDLRWISPIIAALYSGSEEKLNLLKKHNFVFPKELKSYDVSTKFFHIFLARLESENNYSRLVQLIDDPDMALSDQIKFMIFTYFMEKRPEWVLKLIKEEKLDPNLIK